DHRQRLRREKRPTSRRRPVNLFTRSITRGDRNAATVAVDRRATPGNPPRRPGGGPGGGKKRPSTQGPARPRRRNNHQHKSLTAKKPPARSRCPRRPI